MEQVIVLIPALNPLPTIVHFVEKLKMLAIEKIIIVNDGSDTKYNEIFKQLLMQECIVLTHERNIGKGQALKTGMDYIAKSSLRAKGIITVGAHGQHSILDIEQILASTKIFSDGIVLGIRDFKGSEYPLMSQLQNRASSMLFELFFQKRLVDTQTGLRYIPRQYLHWLLKVKGETFRYDTNMLVEAIKRKIPLYEVPIGHAKLRKNAIIYYDEVTNHAQVIQQIWLNFFHKEASANETFLKPKRK